MLHRLLTSAPLSCSWSLSAISAMNSELVGFLLALLADSALRRKTFLLHWDRKHSIVKEKAIFQERKKCMKQPLKMHRPSSVFAAVIMILSQGLYIAASLTASSTNITPLFLITLLGNTLPTIMLSVILFRGRKDVFAGVVLLLTVIAPALSAAYRLVLVLLNTGSTLYVLLCGLSGLVLAVFRGLSAGECLSNGKISAGGGRILLWLLPGLCFCVELWAQLLLCSYDDMTTGEMVTSSLIYLIPQWLGPILMGISLSVPEKREAY